MRSMAGRGHDPGLPLTLTRRALRVGLPLAGGGEKWRRAAPPSSTFVERHDLWSDEQARRAKAVAQAIKKNKLELVRFSFADQHGVLRGKTVVAAEAPG